MKLYTIQGTVNGKQIPTFFLDADIQGITSAWHAEQIAENMFRRNSDDVICISAMANQSDNFENNLLKITEDHLKNIKNILDNHDIKINNIFANVNVS